MKETTAFCGISGGGYKCHCCGPKPGKERTDHRRMVKHRIKAFVRKLVEQAIVEGV